MKRVLAMVYGLGCYLFAGAAALYLAGLVFDLGVPSRLPTIGDWSLADIAFNQALVTLFGVQHSVMARPAFKRWWTRFVPPTIERSTYLLASSIALSTLVACWQPLGRPAGQLPTAFRIVMWLITALGGVILVTASFQIDHFELMGLRQVWNFWHNRPTPAVPFHATGLYRQVRHPLMSGLLIILWAPPVPTYDRLLLAAGFTVYILIARRWEERDLIAAFGEQYKSYCRSVPALIPWRRSSA